MPTEQTNWASPNVVVKKPKGKIRICGDFRKLNESIRNDRHPLPAIEDLLAQIGTGNRGFAKIDLHNAYHQIPLHPECQTLTMITTYIGTFRYTRMPFGIKSAPDAFQIIMERMLG